MLSQSPSEASNSAVFLKNYLECVEELPVDISKTISIIRELDIKASNFVNETEELAEQIIKSSTEEAKKELVGRLKEILISLQDVQSEKAQMTQIIAEKVESRSRSIETDFQNDIAAKTEEIAATSTAKNASIVQQVLSNLPLKNTSKPGSTASSSTNHSDNNTERNGSKRLRRTRMDTELERAETPKPVKVEVPAVTVNPKDRKLTVTHAASSTKKVNAVKAAASNNNGNNGKKKIKKQKAMSTSSKQSSTPSVQEEVTIEDENDDEETYCLCGQVSYGEMILCDNDACKIEWFHFSCVSLTSKPKGKWFCPGCRHSSDRPNVLAKSLRKKS